MSRWWELNPRPFPYQGNVLPLNYIGKKLGGAGFAPAKAKLPSGLQPDPFVYLGTHPLSLAFPALSRWRSASPRFGSLSIGGDTKSFSPSMALGHFLKEIVLAVTPSFLVGMVGIEPTTSPLSGVRSTTELHAHHFFNITFY